MPKSTFVTLKPSQDNPFPKDFEAAIKEMKRATNQNLELWYRSLYLNGWVLNSKLRDYGLHRDDLFQNLNSISNLIMSCKLGILRESK